MELVRKMKVPADFFYGIIVNSVLSDIQLQTEKEVSESELKGFEYVKTFSKQAKATIQIKDITKDKFYQYRTSSTKHVFLVTYDIQKLTDDSFELHYSEKMESYGGFLQKLNDASVGIVWSWLKKKKFKEMLNQIEASYLNTDVDK